MRKTLVALLIALAACGGKDGGSILSPASTKGDLVFSVDANSCSGLGTRAWEFYVDGGLQGTASLAPGGKQSFHIDAGGHTVSAKLANTTFSTSTSTITVPANGTFTYTITC